MPTLFTAVNFGRDFFEAKRDFRLNSLAWPRLETERCRTGRG